MELVFNKHGPDRGKPLVLLHGFPMDSRIWDRVLAEACGRVITADLFGFGRSANASPFTIDSVAVELHRCLGEMNALPCVLGGLSMGGCLAMSFAARFPADLAGLILIDTRAAADDGPGKLARDQMIQLVREKGTAAVVEQMLPRLLGNSPKPAVRQSLKNIMLGCPPIAIEHAVAAMRDRADHTRTLKNLKSPAMILVGDEDRITPPAIALQMQKDLPGAELIVFCGAGHMTPMEQPHQIAHALNFFRDRRILRD